MSSLDNLLTDTMLGKASSKPKWQHVWAPFPITEPSPVLVDADEEGVYENNPVWHFESPAFAGAGVRVANVKCKVRNMNYMKMPVLDLVEWGPVTVRSDYIGGTVSLPLTKDFLVKSRYVKDGFIPGSNYGYWQLTARVDQSFEMVFGYEILPFADLAAPLASPTPTPLSSESLSSDELMPEASCSVCPADPSTDVVFTLRPPPLRVIVVITLVCCKERYDFVPGNVLGAGRIYPMLMIVANSPLQTAKGSVKLTRPSKTAHTEMGGELMSSDIGSAFFTDRNDPGVVVRPFWSNIFDYYYIDPPTGTYTLVKPSNPAVIIRDAVTLHERSSVWGTEDTSGRDVRKVQGQGEFDNIHLAPKMAASREIQKANSDLTGLNEVTMAPFCMHDCFHTHWRWSADYTDQYNKGWDGHTPYALAGAPLVPGNQTVTLDLLSPVSYRYNATAALPAAAGWQIIMHHGGAYALSVNALTTAAKQVVLSIAASNKVYIKMGGGTWATFYWWLRYERSSWRGNQFERLTWTSQQFAVVRGVAAAAAASP